MTTVVSTSACQAYGDVAPSTAASSRIPAPSWRLLAPAGTLPQDRQQTAILRHAESGDLFRHDESDDAYAAAKRWPREHRDSLQRTRVGLDACDAPGLGETPSARWEPRPAPPRLPA